eukprot:scaffold10288_cov154-Isochrysis_galbana.AAC.4
MGQRCLDIRGKRRERRTALQDRLVRRGVGRWRYASLGQLVVREKRVSGQLQAQHAARAAAGCRPEFSPLPAVVDRVPE